MIDTKFFVESLKGKPIGVYGLGLSGFSVASVLRKAGANVFAWDEDEEKRYFANQANIKISNFEEEGLNDYAALVLSPGVPLYYPQPNTVVKMARDNGVEILGDIEILHRSIPTLKSIGITGTNGKSTTTALIHHIMTECGVDNVMGGNIGKPVLDLNVNPYKTTAILELSSYQLDLCLDYHPNISVLLNITPDHLDRHGDMNGYIAAKEQIFKGDGVAICNIDDKPSKDIFDRVSKVERRRIFAISLNGEVQKGIYIKNGILFDCLSDEKQEIGIISDIPTLLGSHNQQNIAAAYGVCKIHGLPSDDILKAIKTYKGLPHRQFLTRVINGIGYVNDSKATNVDAAEKAIACYKNIYLIAGGRPKEGGLNGLEKYYDSLRHIFLIGEASDDFAKWCEKNHINHTKCQSLDVAVLAAHHMAQSSRGEPGGAATVLLSPACASWDQFKNFEHRGDVFMDLVKSLSEEVLR